MTGRGVQGPVCSRCGGQLRLDVPDGTELVDLAPFLAEHLTCLTIEEPALAPRSPDGE